jgi:cell fate (sporulation/competence/biofilm development) regulator YlbF (YheA/YmcA/DUF963 family)
MEIMEAATLLGTTIKESELYRKFDAAKTAYENNVKIAEYLHEYEADRKTLEKAGSMEDVDSHLVDTLQARLDELYKLITEDPVYVAFTEAQTEINALMEMVNDQITFAITGKAPCKHDCSSCGGSCHH